MKKIELKDIIKQVIAEELNMHLNELAMAGYGIKTNITNKIKDRGYHHIYGPDEKTLILHNIEPKIPVDFLHQKFNLFVKYPNWHSDHLAFFSGLPIEEIKTHLMSETGLLEIYLIENSSDKNGILIWQRKPNESVGHIVKGLSSKISSLFGSLLQ